MLCPGTPRSVCAMARPDFPRSLAEFQDRFAAEEDCRRYLVACRWPDGFRRPRCGAREAYEVAGRKLLQCRACRHQASVTAGTVLHRTHVPLVECVKFCKRAVTLELAGWVKRPRGAGASSAP